MWWVPLVAAAVDYVSSSESADDAADAQTYATDKATGEQRRQYEQTRADFAPWREAGARALTSLEADIGGAPTPAEVMSDPGYQFGLTEGQKALDRKIAAMGGRVSGAALKATARYNQGYAGNAYNAAYQRRQDRLNRLAALAGIGQTATGSSAAAGANATNAISGLISSQGDAQAAQRMYQGGLWGNAANQAAAIYSRYQNGNTSDARGGYRYDDPYRNPMYFGGAEGE